MKSSPLVGLVSVALLALIAASCGSSGNHLVRIAVSPNPADLSASQSLQLQAVGTYSDGTTKVLSSVAWTFSSPSPAVNVSSRGLATCSVSGGPAATAGTVTASFAGVSGSAVISCSGPGI